MAIILTPMQFFKSLLVACAVGVITVKFVERKLEKIFATEYFPG